MNRMNMIFKNNLLLNRKVFSFLFLFIIGIGVFAQSIRISGVVTNDKGDRLPFVVIRDLDSKRNLVKTDEDGRFALNVLNNSRLEFSCIGFYTKRVRIKDQTKFKIILKTKEVNLSGAGVKAKRIVDAVVPEPTDIEVKGNYFHIKTHIRIPRQLYTSDVRLVVQPMLHNVTLDKDRLMTPLAFEGKEYKLTQARLFDFDITKDSLSSYVVDKKETTQNKRKDIILLYKDSIYVKNVKHDYSCDIYMAMENYRRIVFGDTTTIARGTVNPLRFLDYHLEGMNITDSAYFPKAEMQLRDSKGQIDFVFPIGKATIDENDEKNKKELAKLVNQLHKVEYDKNTDLRNFEIVGYASPDGRYASNLKLANKRLKFSLDLILKQLSEKTRKTMNVKSEAIVSPWTDLVELLKKDNKTEIAEKIDAIIKKYPKNIDYQSIRISTQKFYKELKVTYLPKLRRSEYTFSFSVFRKLTIDEIQELYDKDYEQLSRYEIWRLYTSKKDTTEKYKICAQALELYPSFMVAANDFAAYKIAQKQSDVKILESFAGADAPNEVNSNQVIALLDAGSYSKADTIASYIQDNEGTKLLKAITEALNGKYTENYKIIAATSPFNKTLILLAMKKGKEAYEVSKTLDEKEAMTFYLRAVCLSRLDKPSEAWDVLQKALEMDKSLLKIAQIDGDVNDLLPETMKTKK